MFLLVLFLLFGCHKANSTAKSPSGAADSQAKPKQPPLVQSVKLGPIDAKLAEKGEKLYKEKCTSCHRLTVRHVGPPLEGVTKKRKPEWIMNMILYPDWMVKNDPIAKQLIAQYAAPMANLNLSKEEARAILEYLRLHDSQAQKKEKK